MSKKKRIPPVEQIPAEVPATYIKEKYVDKDLEVYSCLDAPLVIDGFSMRAPSLGVFSIIETFDCKLIGDPQNAKIEDLLRFLYINEYREKCVQEVHEWISQMGGEYVRGDLPQDVEDWHTFDVKVFAWGADQDVIKNLDPEELSHFCLSVANWISLSFTGFEMIPPGAGGGASHLFGAEAMGSIIAGIGKFMNVSYRELLWDTPYSLIGHVVAQACKNNGAEGVSRPKDPDDIKRQLRLCKELQHDGKLLPWQIDAPLQHRLTDFQQEYHPQLQKEFERLQEQARNNK